VAFWLLQTAEYWGDGLPEVTAAAEIPH